MRELSKQISIGIGIAVVLLVVNAIVSYGSISQLIENERLVSHTHQVIGELESMFSTVKDAETGQRGYLLTGEPQYLEPYQTAIAQIKDKVTTLQNLTADNQRQQKRIADLQPLIAQKLVELEQTIKLRQEQGFAAAVAIVRTDQGKNIMDGIRQQVAVIEQEENQLLQQRAEDCQVGAKNALLTFSIATLADFLLLGLVYYLIRQGQFKRVTELEKENQLLHELETEKNYLQRSEARYRSLVIASSQALWLTNPKGEVVEEIPAWLALTGQTQKEAQGWGWLSKTIEAERDGVAKGFLQAIANKTIYESEQTVKVADGTYRLFAVKSVPILDGNGEICEWMGTYTDITARKQAEADIRQLNENLEQRVIERTQQLEEANEELEAFAYSIAHDLRAPLRAMQGFAEALLEDYGNCLDEVGKEYAHRIVTSSGRLEDLIQDLLAYSRLTRAELNLRNTNLINVVEEAINQLQTDSLQFTIKGALPSVMAHRSTLVQVITNLLSNAIKFVTVGVQPQVTISAELRGEWVRLVVADNGIGIASEHQQRIFRVFERLHGIESYPGTGIGLAIVRKGIERMGGHVGVESQVGQASRFWIELKSVENR